MSEKSPKASLEAMQEWYDANCDGEWEHEFGIRIENVDNPGWTVSIPIAETTLEGRPFDRVQWKRSRNDWLICRVEELTFVGDGGSKNLTDILGTFLEWAQGSDSAAAE